MTKQSSLAVLFYVLLRHTNIMAEKGFNLFYECAARCVHLCPGSMANSQRMLTEINKSGAIAKIRI